jgi:hypothetical protein
MESSSNELLLRMELARLLRFQREMQLQEFDSLTYMALVRRLTLECLQTLDDGQRRKLSCVLRFNHLL